MSDLRSKMDAAHLNFERRFLRILGHELWPLRPLPSPRSGRSQVSFPVGSTLRRGEQSSAFRLPTAVDLYGFCAVDLEGRIARHSHLSQRPERSPLPSWFSRTSCQVHLGRCQRAERLSTLGRSRPRAHVQGVPFEVSKIQINQQKTPLRYRKRGLIGRGLLLSGALAAIRHYEGQATQAKEDVGGGLWDGIGVGEA